MVGEDEARQEGVMVAVAAAAAAAVADMEDARNRITEAFWFAIFLLIAGSYLTS